jgi:hypothetical protein
MRNFLQLPSRYILYSLTLSLGYRLLRPATKLSGIAKNRVLSISFAPFKLESLYVNLDVLKNQ